MKRTQLMLVALAMSTAVVLWYFLLIGPQRNDHRVLGEQLAAAESQERELRSTVARLRRLAAEDRTRAAELERFTRLVPAAPDVAGFILAANDAAVRSRVDWISLSPAPPTAGPAGGPSAIPVSIAVNANFFALLDYVRRLEDLGRLVVVDSIALESGGAAGGLIRLSATLNARIFTRAQAGPPPGSPAHAPAEPPPASRPGPS